MKTKVKRFIFLIFLSIISLNQFVWANTKGKSVQEKVIKTSNTLKVTSGSIERFYFQSDLIDPRNIDVWLPKDYSLNKEYAVLYMHDGQNLFDATSTWTSKEWEVDETLTKLSKEKSIKDVIVVGIHNNGNKRHIEYFPEKTLEYVSKTEKDNLLLFLNDMPLSDNYLKFIVSELKPFIDKTYSVNKGPDATFLCGSSMGGLISIYGLCEYPEVFGGAACLSTHWIGTFEYNKKIPEGINSYLKGHLPNPENHKIYFDHGTEGLDAYYPEFQKMINQTV